jgi:hypothetical protein
MYDWLQHHEDTDMYGYSTMKTQICINGYITMKTQICMIGYSTTKTHMYDWLQHHEDTNMYDWLHHHEDTDMYDWLQHHEDTDMYDWLQHHEDTNMYDWLQHHEDTDMYDWLHHHEDTDMYDWLQHHEDTDVEQKWDDLKNILRRAEESLGKIKVKHRRIHLKILDTKIKEVNEKKKIAYRRCSNTKSIRDKINHKRLSAIAKRERREIGFHARNLHQRRNMTLASRDQTLTKY